MTLSIDKALSPSYYEGRFNGDYNIRLDTVVGRLLALTDAEGKPPTVEQRKQIIEILTNAVIEQTGHAPNGVQAGRLANWILYESLIDSHPDKVARTEYPILTKRQLRTRYNREYANENIPETHTEQHYLEGKKDNRWKIKGI